MAMKTSNSNKQIDKIQSSQRIRDNQRRSRARRKEYIQDLEQRIRQFELLGVQATQEIQQAGRKVVEENNHLRSLLKLHGVSNQEIQQFLAKAATMPSSSHMDTILKAQQHPQKSLISNTGSENPSQVKSLSYEFKEPLHGIVAPESTSLHMSPRISQQVVNFENQITEGRQREPVDYSTQNNIKLQPSSRTENSGQYTPCETAAEIILSLRNNFDTQDVRLQLGCQSNSSCMVKNMDIFGLLDD